VKYALLQYINIITSRFFPNRYTCCT